MGSRRKKRSASGMHCCPTCDSTLVQLVNWQGHGDGHWRVELRCPECGRWSLGRYSQAEVDDYDRELDRGGRALLEDLRSLTLANMEEEEMRAEGEAAPSRRSRSGP